MHFKCNFENKIQDYVTYGRTFENYRWYRPLITAVATAIIYLILIIILSLAFEAIFGQTFVNHVTSAYEGLNVADAANVYGFLILVMFVPSLYLATRIVKDRPFSSYSSTRGGWDWKLYLKCIPIPLALYAIAHMISITIEGSANGPNQLTPLVFIIFLIIVPAQCIAEEYMFRGLIMQTIGSWVKIPIVAIIAQTLIFAALHPYNIIGVVAIIVGGIIFGVIAWKSNGLECGSALHSVNNLFLTLLVLGGFEKAASAVSISDATLAISIEVISAAILLYVGKKYEWF